MPACFLVVTFIAASASASALVLAGDDPTLDAAATTMGGQLATQAAAQAETAARQAWALEAQVKKIGLENLEYVPLVKAEIAMAQSAADTAKESDEQATKLYEETLEKTQKAATEAADEYLTKVRAEAAAATASSAAKRAVFAKAAEENAGLSAARAAMPYHGNLLRLQSVAVLYERRAQAMAAASNNLRGEGLKLAQSANQYQAVGQTVQASQILVQAHSLVDQSQRLKTQATQLQATAQELYNDIPLYGQAEQAAANSAAAAANPPALPRVLPLPY